MLQEVETKGLPLSVEEAFPLWLEKILASMSARLTGISSMFCVNFRSVFFVDLKEQAHPPAAYCTRSVYERCRLRGQVWICSSIIAWTFRNDQG